MHARSLDWLSRLVIIAHHKIETGPEKSGPFFVL